jgi:hypothetical protein
VEPGSGVSVEVSPNSSPNVVLRNDIIVPLPVLGPFGPEIRLPLYFDSWKDVELACWLRNRGGSLDELAG